LTHYPVMTTESSILHSCLSRDTDSPAFSNLAWRNDVHYTVAAGAVELITTVVECGNNERGAGVLIGDFVYGVRVGLSVPKSEEHKKGQEHKKGLSLNK
jgi:hypothetical protein